MVGQLTCLDLFSGCGGFGLGAELAGYNVVAAVDIEPNLQSAYRLNFPRTQALQADISQLGQSAWSGFFGKGKPRLDLLIGGPPCQGFSRMGLRNTGDPRNELIGQYFRHVKMLQPRVFVMENVEGLMDQRNIGFLQKAISELPGNYTIVGPVIVNAADLGAATNRRRVIVIGYDKNDVDPIDLASIEGLKAPRRTTVRDAIADLPAPVSFNNRSPDFGWTEYPAKPRSEISMYARTQRSMPRRSIGWHDALQELAQGRVSGLHSTKHTTAVIERFIETPQGATERISKSPKLSWDGQCPTLRAGTGAEKGSFQAVRPLHPTDPRVITVREAARLQGFPDWFVFHPTKWHSFRMIGNSVSPIVSQALLCLVSAKSAVRKAA
ncbi:DNA (cytosine-5-)-methyltransferase [Ochrobactrum sp. EEELCW01]|nr:DNA (cytosine-5-)-methyltransferase [Ochrobactrum sp. EEELCW01]